VRLLVTGARGQLGRALAERAGVGGHELVGVDLPELDITDLGAVRDLVGAVRPAAIVNCAAYTAVDRAETDEAAALAVNGTAVAHLAAVADEHGAALVQVSTDYVFDGLSDRPYREDDPVAPRSAYGRTKLAGELAAQAARRHLVVRTAWLYGEGANFVGAIRRQIAAGATELRVVADQHGSPTWAADLAGAIVALLGAGAEGVVHAVNAGSTTWFGFASEIVRLLGARINVVPVSTSEYPRPAPRPPQSTLATERLTTLLGRGLPPWQDALRRFLAAGDLGRPSAP